MGIQKFGFILLARIICVTVVWLVPLYAELQTVSCLYMQWNQPDSSHTDYASKHDKAKLLYSHGPITDSVATNIVDTDTVDTQTAFQTSEPRVRPDELPAPGNKRAPGGTLRMG